MELALICLKQVVQLFILILFGIIMDKTKMVNNSGKQILSSILINFAVPCMIVNSYFNSFNDDVSNNITLSFIYSFLICALGIVISIIASKPVEDKNKGTFRFACSFSNAAYMGFPLVKALLGDEGIIYASSYVTIFNILLWSIGYMFFSNKTSFKDLLKKLVTCPPIIAVIIGLLIYAFKIPVSEVIATPINSIGSMTTPISMIIIGITIAQSNVKELLKNIEVYYAITIRLIIIPILSLLLIKLFKMPDIVRNAILILHACPAAAITTLLAIENNKDEQYAAGIVVVSIILSILTLPLYTYLLTLI